MSTLPLRFHLEIDYLSERHGWIDSYLTTNDQRHQIWTSSSLPPFAALAQFIKALVAQRLPTDFYWEEEGPYVFFEALPVAPDHPECQLRFQYHPYPDGERRLLDLRSLPLARLLRLLEA